MLRITQYVLCSLQNKLTSDMDLFEFLAVSVLAFTLLGAGTLMFALGLLIFKLLREDIKQTLEHKK